MSNTWGPPAEPGAYLNGVNLARLLAKQDRGAEACAMLAQIYDWFTEGFDTKDLQEAKALLEELT